MPSLPSSARGKVAEAEGGGEGEDDGGDQVERRDQGAQHRRQDQPDHQQDERHDQAGVAGGRLLDVVVLRRDPASRAGGEIACRRSRIRSTSAAASPE